ncbi:penicillin-binding transpeptidase domain-containing protein [Lentzea sp. NPDC051208]|uniref:penicillin-binding transpeptidase domain-containing protein n=1 Tax=Lentzea sp. NPDC051208 TaxID=3154642 RepID=UPI00342B6BBD
MRGLSRVFGALVLVGAVVAVVVWQRPEVTPPASAVLKDVVVQYADGSPLWSSADGGPKSPLVAQVLDEVRLQGSLDLDGLRRSGATVVTTIDRKAQAAGTAAIDAVAPGQPQSLRYALTAVDPATGGVLAYVPSARGAQSSQGPDATDYAGGVLRQPGAAIFPVTVVAALQQGQSLDGVFDGRSPRTLGGVQVRDEVACGERCTLRDALAKSSNVVLYDLIVNQIGTEQVRTAGLQAGVPKTVVLDGEEHELLTGVDGGVPNAGIGIGVDDAAMRPLDLATVYATFAAGGVRHRTHFVSEVSSEDGSPLYQAAQSPEAAFDQDVARSREIASQVTTVLRDSTRCPGAVCRDAAYEFPAGDVRGLHTHAWTAGYTDRMAITVLVTGEDPAQPASVASGRPVGQAGLPNAIWQEFRKQA